MDASRTFRAHAAAAGVDVRSAGGDGRVLACEFESPALGRRASCLLVTPPQWRDNVTYPVLYLLHGSDDVPSCWLEHTDLLELSAGTDALLVLPEAGVVGYYTDWCAPASDGIRPEWERFHLQEIPQRVLAGCRFEKRFTVAGISMGGFGALAYASKHPDRFGAAASLSGLPHITKRSIAAFVTFTLRRQGESGSAPFGRWTATSSSWVKCDPYWNAGVLRDTRLYLAWGDGRKAPGDEVYPGSGTIERIVAGSNRSFERRLRTLGVRHVSSVHTGTHDWPYWRRELRRAWPFLAKDFAANR